MTAKLPDELRALLDQAAADLAGHAQPLARLDINAPGPGEM